VTEAELVRERVQRFADRLAAEAAKPTEYDDIVAKYRSYAIANAFRIWTKATSETASNGGFYEQATKFVSQVEFWLECSSQKGQLAGYEWVQDQLDSL
jgi:hypothetical protein